MVYDPQTRTGKVLKRLNRPMVTPIRFNKGHLYYAVLNLRFGKPNVFLRRYGVTTTICRLNLKTGRSERILTEDIRAFTVLSGGEIIFSKDRSHRFGSELWGYHNGEKRLILESDILIGEIISRDGEIYLTGRRDWETWNIYRLGKDRLRPVITSPWVLANLNITADRLIFTGNVDQRYRIYCLSNGVILRLTRSGYANFGSPLGDSLYFIGLNPDGFDLYVTELSPDSFRFPPDPLIPPRPEIEAMTLDTRRGSYLDVAKTLLLPPLRLPIIAPRDTTFTKFLLGGFILGGDVTGENIYTVSLAHDGLVDSIFFHGQFNSNLFAPLGLWGEYRYHCYGCLSADYPLLITTDPGLNQIWLTLRGRSVAGFKRRELTPGIDLRLGWPDLDIWTSFGVDLEKGRIAPEGMVRSELYLLGGVFRFDLDGFHDPDNPDSIPIQVRGDGIRAKSGGRLSLGFSRPILKLRWGLWNPNIFFEDLCGGLFFDYARSARKEIYSVGMLLNLETGLALGLVRIAPGVGLAITSEKEIEVFFDIQSRRWRQHLNERLPF
jgi:hypothetical protein